MNTKTCVRVFLNRIDGQAGWLNAMAEKGWRLVSYKWGIYKFEPCKKGEYIYYVEYQGRREKRDLEKHHALLKEKQTQYWVVGEGIDAQAFSAMRRHPFDSKEIRKAMPRGSLYYENLILEKKKDKEGFGFLSDGPDRVVYYKRLRKWCIWLLIVAICGMLAGVNSFIGFTSLGRGNEAVLDGTLAVLMLLCCIAFSIAIWRLNKRIQTWR